MGLGRILAQPMNAFLHYTTNEGLSNDNITAIAKDGQGFLWVGTVNGLNRFDGLHFKVFRHDPKHKNSLPNNHILGITLAPDGYLWVASGMGLSKLDPLNLEFQNFTFPEALDSLENDAASPVVFDAQGTAWTTTHYAIRQLDPNTGKLLYSYETKSNSLGWFSTIIDTKGRIWMANNDIHRFDTATKNLKKFVGANPSEGFEQSSPLSVNIDAEGQIWVGSWHGGIWKYHEALDEFVKLRLPTTYAPILMSDESAKGKVFLWVGGGDTGLARFYPSSFEYFEFKPDIRDPCTHNNYQAKCFYKDPKNGDVWVGTEIGLEHYAPSTIRFGRTMIPLEKSKGTFSLVCAVVKDRTDAKGQRYFVGVWGTGLYSWNRATGEIVRMDSGKSKFSSEGIFNLFQDSRGVLWGCMGHGVSRYDPRTGKWRDYEGFFKDTDQSSLIWCGLEDRRGNLWFGSRREGLYRYDPVSDRMEQAVFDKAYANNKGHINVLYLSEDAHGRIWMSCANSGLIRFDPATRDVKRFNYQISSPNAGCRTVEAASNGMVYAGFTDAVLELDTAGNVLRRFDATNGILSSKIMFMAEDRQGRIWFTSEYLLHCLDPKTGEFTYFGKEDGLFSNAMTDALSVTHDGEFFIGFQNAFSYFHPERLRQNTTPPPVVITSMKVMDEERRASIQKTFTIDLRIFSSRLKQVQYDTFLAIKPGEDFFTIEFAALNFNQPQRNRYAYMLEGFNRDWVFTDRPVATFTNMDGGTYTFRVKAQNNDGVWNENGASIQVRVKPPFIKSWWFKLLLASILGLFSFGIFKYRQYQRRRLERFREALARDLHDEMGSTLSSIRFFSEFASQQVGDDKPAVKPIMERISQSASTLSESMQDIIWAMKTKNDHLEDLGARMTEFGLRLLEAKGIRFKTLTDEGFSGKHLSPEQRRNIYLIFKEALNNVAKYAEASEATLALTVRQGQLFLIIEDNGKGFEMDESGGAKEVSGGGNGLKNMHQRAADIKGKLDIHAEPGKGTRVELRVKL